MLNTIVTADMLTGILAEVKGLIPIVLPTVVGFIALRKGWSFLISTIHGA